MEKTKGANEEDLFVLVQEEDEEGGRRGSKRSRTANWRNSTSGWPPVKPSPMKACKECDGCKAKKGCTNKIPR